MLLQAECTEAPWIIYSDGTIVSRKTKKKRKGFISKNGYEMHTYSSKEGTKNFYTHILVAKHFIGVRPDGYEVNHKDGVKTNNDYTNLEYTSKSGNISHAVKTGLKPNMIGETNGMSKLSEEKAIALIQDIKNGLSNPQIGDKYNLHPRYVSLIRHKKRWKYLWDKIEGSTTIESTSLDGSE